jgi:hypothetical protein
MSCRGICSRYKALKKFGETRYESGQKRCSSCDVFVNWDGTNCPCCGMALRTHPRGTQERQRLLLIRQQKKKVLIIPS